ncbi:unnamed protein product [Anisakis simplex]|uniref:CPXV162 protein n=1 Tax=Anisakis simplex TaxID=6269 RepID=A0A0M3J9A0_ANISI|nr:unnamed protein product [Anisakis simplex]
MAFITPTEVEQGNETVADVVNVTIISTPIILDIAHPIISVESLYENSRERVYNWMDEPNNDMMVRSALMGAFSAVVSVFLMYLIYSILCKCRSRKRQRKIDTIANELNDPKNPFSLKDDDGSDADLI